MKAWSPAQLAQRRARTLRFLAKLLDTHYPELAWLSDRVKFDAREADEARLLLRVYPPRGKRRAA